MSAGRRFARWAVPVALCIMAAAGFAQAADAQDPASAEARARARAVAVEAYAKEAGVSRDQAREVLEVQARASDLPDALRKELGQSYGQMWFVGGHVFVAVGPGGDLEVAQRVIADHGLAAATTVERVRWNETGLRAAFDAVGRALVEEVRAGTATPVIVGGGLRVVVAARPSAALRDTVEEAARRGAVEHDVPYSIVESSRESLKAAPAYTLPGDGWPLIAGMRYISDTGYQCTLAFRTYSPSNSVVSFMTAGHCQESGWRYACTDAVTCSHFGYDAGGYVSGAGDAGIVILTEAAWATYPAVLNWLDQYQGVGVFGASDSAFGGFYCHTGMGSASRGWPGTTCGTNNGTARVSYSDYPGVVLVLQQMSGMYLCAIRGDSGGPVWNIYNGHAIGMTSGGMPVDTCGNAGAGTSTTLYYTDVRPAARAFGVQVLTL